MRIAALLLLMTATATAQVAGTRRVRVDFYQGPIVSSSRVIGLGGAYVGIAEGADGHLVNPAAFAVRYPYTADDWYDWDFAFSWLNLAGGEIDLDQSGRTGDFEKAQLLQAGVNFKLGRHGFGFHLLSQSFDLAREVDGADTAVTYGQTQGGLGYAYAFQDGQLIVGGILGGGTAEVRFTESNETIASITGGGSQVGVLYAPFDASWRLGSSLRSEIIGKEAEGRAEVVGSLVPTEVVVPSELSIGGSYRWGERPYNPRPGFGDRPRAPASPLSRRYILVAADMVLTGKVDDAVSARAFLDGDGRRAGADPALSLRGGVESEILPDLVALRCGTYFEPSRLRAGAGRWHATAGADLHVDWGWAWKIAGVFDGADGYLNWGLGVGFWH
ncbi:MAG: hypothetical protein H6706_26930 [Myxococcales bacterium]|nr:hypothetical protein [Myxococcales bacterium]